MFIISQMSREICTILSVLILGAEKRGRSAGFVEKKSAQEYLWTIFKYNEILL